MSDTVLVDELLAGHSLMRVKDKQKVESLLKTLNSGGLEKLQVVADFDYTLTKTRNEKGSLDCSWGVLENSPLMPESYTKECNALKARYLPIELVKNLSSIIKTKNFIKPLLVKDISITIHENS